MYLVATLIRLELFQLFLLCSASTSTLFHFNEFGLSTRNNSTQEGIQEIEFVNNGRDIHGKRSKRFLIYEGGGISKMVVGFSDPILLMDRKPFRQLNVIYNIQAQYGVPRTPIYWWDLFTTYQRRYKRMKSEKMVYDESREFVYRAIEEILNRNGLNGNQCLLRAICEVAKDPINGHTIFHELLSAILIPPNGSINEMYTEARRAGLYGVNCQRNYWRCSNVKNWLLNNSFFI